MRIVINKCYGGFGLSHEAILRYAEIKGLALFPEKDASLWYTYYTVPKDQRVADVPDEEWYKLPEDKRLELIDAFSKQTLYSRDIPRDDPALVQVVEELGDKAAGDCASLKIVEIPDEVQWEIEEYDGMEWVAEAHRTWS